MKRGNRWRGIAAAVLAGAVIMAGCASAKDSGTSTVDDTAVGTVEQFTGQAIVPVTKQQVLRQNRQRMERHRICPGCLL